MNEVEVTENGRPGSFRVHFSPKLVILVVLLAAALAVFNYGTGREQAQSGEDTRARLRDVERKISKIEGTLEIVFPSASRLVEKRLTQDEMGRRAREDGQGES